MDKAERQLRNLCFWVKLDGVMRQMHWMPLARASNASAAQRRQISFRNIDLLAMQARTEQRALACLQCLLPSFRPLDGNSKTLTSRPVVLG